MAEVGSDVPGLAKETADGSPAPDSKSRLYCHLCASNGQDARVLWRDHGVPSAQGTLAEMGRVPRWFEHLGTDRAEFALQRSYTADRRAVVAAGIPSGTA